MKKSRFVIHDVPPTPAGTHTFEAGDHRAPDVDDVEGARLVLKARLDEGRVPERGVLRENVADSMPIVSWDGPEDLRAQLGLE